MGFAIVPNTPPTARVLLKINGVYKHTHMVNGDLTTVHMYSSNTWDAIDIDIVMDIVQYSVYYTPKIRANMSV